MTKIFELKQKQAEALEALEWASDNDELETIQKVLNSVQGEVSQKLDYWLPLLKQAQFDTDQAMEAKKRYIAAHDANIKRKSNVAKFIKEHILNLMLTFDIDKHKGDLFNCSHYLSTGSLEFSDGFNLKDIPDDFKYTQEFLDKNAVSACLRSCTDINEKQEITSIPELPGCYLVKKQALRVS